MLNVVYLCVNCKEEVGITSTFFQRKGGVTCTPTPHRLQTGMDYTVLKERTLTQTWPGNMVGKSCKHLHKHKLKDPIRDYLFKVYIKQNVPL